MFKRQRTGSVVCPCGSLVGVNDEQCYTCGRRNPGLWGYASMLRVLGGDIGFFVTLILYGCSILYGLGLLLSYRWGFDIMGGGNPLGALSPAPLAKLLFGASGAAPVFQVRDVVDRPQRRLAPRWDPPSALQHDGGAQPCAPHC